MTTEARLQMLFVDDDWKKRINPAIEMYSDMFNVDVATNVPNALRMMVGTDYDVISLDFDLGGHDFSDINDKDCGMEIVRYAATRFPKLLRKKPEFWIHSTNLFASHQMFIDLEKAGFVVVQKPFNWKKYQNGVIAGAFDVIHPGYVKMFEEAKELCHTLTILLHDKPNQVFFVEDRVAILRSIKYVDRVIVYQTEKELTDYLKSKIFDVRIIGSDHKDKTSRPNLPLHTHYHQRNHDWSATQYKQMIADHVNAEKK